MDSKGYVPTEAEVEAGARYAVPKLIPCNWDDDGPEAQAFWMGIFRGALIAAHAARPVADGGG